MILAALLSVLPGGALAEPKDPVSRGLEILLERQESLDEGKPLAEWPYEGVYREKGEIPIGYRVGGTSIAAWAILETGERSDEGRAQAAVERGLRFVLEHLDDEAMAAEFRGRYDVRGWGHVYALTFLLRLRALERVPEVESEEVDAKVSWLVEALETTELTETGGWNYSRGQGASSHSSPFMTAPTVLALWEAARQGEEVEPAVVNRALDALEACRTEEGAIAYTSSGRRSTLPGSVARTPVAEMVLLAAGRSSADSLSKSVGYFFEHWNELESRRRQTGTHEGPHGVAPYYFYYGHYYAAAAIEQLPDEQRPKWRARFVETLMGVREESGGWNDRVFPRSESYGTAMAILALLESKR